MRIHEQLHQLLQHLITINLKRCFRTAREHLHLHPHHRSSRHSDSLLLTQLSLSNMITNALMLITAGITSYWILQILQTPYITQELQHHLGSKLLLNETPQSGYTLFGTKPLSVQNIFLRGLVITSTSTSGKLDGFAVFEVDGKPSKAIAIGENLGNNLVLQSIHNESVTLLYQGQQLEFPISKTKSASHLKS